MKAWITKHALTSGIEAVEGEISKETPSMFIANGRGWSGYFHKEGRDWHVTEVGARRRAESMRLAKIKSLKSSLAKFESMKF